MAGGGVFRHWLMRGLTDPRPLALAWLVTLLLLGAGALWLELGHDKDLPARADAGEETPANASAPAEATLPEASGTPPQTAPSEPAATGQTGLEQPPGPDGRSTPAETTEPAPLQRDEAPVPALALAMAELPQEDLVEIRDGRHLPKIAADGRQPWRVYRRPFMGARGRPIIAILIQEIGQSRQPTDAAIDRLPGEVTLALSPYARDIEAVAARARAAGHELLLMVPMEPLRYPENDPGPLTLLVGAPAVETIDRLQTAMSRFEGYVGLVNHMGSRFTADEDAMLPVLEEAKRRGLLFVDARATPDSVAAGMARALSMPVLSNDRYIDNEPSADEIDRQLAELVLLATERGAALGIGRPLPVTIERIARWTEGLDARGVALAPVSALIDIADSR
ncbi:MAG: divergent polysaccharide deacetylase family protein [Rhodothalassiaceae bacterium]